MTSSTNSVLNQYLLTVNKQSELKQEKATKKNTSKSVKLQSVDSQASITAAHVYDRLNYFQAQHSKAYKQLSQLQLQLVDEMITLSYGSFESYLTLVDALSDKLKLGSFEIKQELSRLVEMHIILLVEHPWQGKRLKFNPLLIQSFTQRKCKAEKEQQLDQCELLFSTITIPFEKQLLFLMYELKATVLQCNGKLTLNKSQLLEFKGRLLAINPLLSTIANPIFQQYSTPDESISLMAEDELVRFIIQIALSLNVIASNEHGIVWLEANWLEWLNQSIEVQQNILKLIIAQILEQQMNGEFYFCLLTLLHTPNVWRKGDTQLQSSAAPLLKLGYGFGWIEMLTYNHQLFIKHKDVVKTTSSPVVLAQLHLLCLPDCHPAAIWRLRAIANVDKITEIIKLDVTMQSVSQAIANGYDESSMQAMLHIENDIAAKANLNRLVMLVKQQAEQSNPIGKKSDSVEQNISYMSTKSSLIKLISIFENNQSHSIKHEIGKIEARLSHYAARWFTVLNGYNKSTKKQIVECAIEHGIRVEVEINSHCFFIVPKCIKREDDDYSIEYCEAVSHKLKFSNEQRILLSSISKLRLCR